MQRTCGITHTHLPSVVLVSMQNVLCVHVLLGVRMIAPYDCGTPRLQDGLAFQELAFPKTIHTKTAHTNQSLAMLRPERLFDKINRPCIVCRDCRTMPGFVSHDPLPWCLLLGDVPFWV